MCSKLLKSKRVLKGMTQTQTAQNLGMGIKTYNLKENGKRPFTLKEAVKVSKLLELTLDDVNNIFLQL